MTKRPRQQPRRVSGRTLVRLVGTDGRPVTCAWDDCTRPGYEELKVIVKEPGGKNLHYIFCSERHKAYHLGGHEHYGQLGTLRP